jgi:hypothetical protein
MIDRRELLTLGGLLGGLGTAENGGGAAGQTQMSDRNVKDLTDALKAISNALVAQQSFDAINPVRASQNAYLRGNGKFPDFIDVGINVWVAVYDWHVRMQQPLVVGRDANGRYTMMLGFTALVLRQDAVADLLGIPYDNR